MVYPTSGQLQANQGLAQAGTLEIAPMEAPLTLFVWSKQRIMPVRITEFSITEEAFDPTLNPIRAKITLGLRVLSVNDLGFDHKGGSLFMSYLQNKEQLAHARRPAPSAFWALEAYHDGSIQALQALLQPGGLKASLFPPTSRYYGLDTATLETADGRTIIYLRRRFCPPPERFALLQEHMWRRAIGWTTSPPTTWAIRSSSGACATPTPPCAPTS